VMKRDPDIFREILLYLEEHHNEEGSFEINSDTFSNYNFELVRHHVSLLVDKGFLLPVEAELDEQIFVRRMTENGHVFLDSIRDPEIWRRTKQGATAVQSYGLEFLAKLAEGFFKTKIKQHTGLEI